MSSINNIVDFILEHGNTIYVREELSNSIEAFLKNNTCIVLQREGDVVAVCLWNVIGETASVEELVIHPGYGGIKTLKKIASLGCVKFPQLKQIKFIRERKYEGRAPRVVSLQKFLGGN